ncbi:protein CHLOROPLAST ENHANCING STRESS TOLERANCE, chloroplastic-like isoform X1 [Zingiber officinale]|uniref:protein CHLOROPLAST ENHANCING STRESS TOLERANCE, chloroplastic-like isoform X1 n=1 Tax=Zingiber officinale TaxID=94328 RepID=UPI001C4CB829|nr:protein CHLOROPLAST ENHANCING STRESS TOLERANCE, chloroplastic-like isoform X1 [Zingiber officinale]
MALYLPSPPLKLPLALLVPRLSSRTPPSSSLARRCPSVSHLPRRFPGHRRRGGLPVLASVGKEETDVRVSEEDQSDVSPEDLECVREIQRVLELLKKNRDMIFGEVKLTIMIEDPRDVERKRLLGIDDAEDITRDDLVTALEDVNEGRIPKNRVALKLLAKEMTEWPNLEVESLEKGRPRKSLYAKATDTGVDPQAAKRLNIDWDSAVDIDPEDEDGDGDDIDVPPAVGYGALYLVTALPIIIAVSVVLILFYNSLQ